MLVFAFNAMTMQPDKNGLACDLWNDMVVCPWDVRNHKAEKDLESKKEKEMSVLQAYDHSSNAIIRTSDTESVSSRCPSQVISSSLGNGVAVADRESFLTYNATPRIVCRLAGMI